MVLPIGHHVPGRPIREEVITDAIPEVIGGGGPYDMIDEVIDEGGVDLENDMGVELKVLGRSIGRWRVVEEVGAAVANQDHQEEGLPLMIIVIGRVEE